MPTWWGKSASKDVKKKPNKENFFQSLHRFLSNSEQKGIIRSRGSRGRCTDTKSEKGSQSRAASRSPSPSNHVSRCQSFSDRLLAQPLPLPRLRNPGIFKAPSEIAMPKPILEKRGKPTSVLPLATPDHIPSRPGAAHIGGDLATASVSSNCTSDTEDPAEELQSPVRNNVEDVKKIITMNSSSLLHKEQSLTTQKESRGGTMKPVNLPCSNQILSTSPKCGLLNSSIIQNSQHGAFVSAPDSSLSSPSRSPMRPVFPEQIPNSVFWAAKPYSDVNILSSGQCSSPGSGQTSGHNSMGGDISGQLFWLYSRPSPECSPIPSPRMTSPGPSSRIHSGAVTPLHPRAGGTAPGSPTCRNDDGKKQSHRLPLPPITISSNSPFSTLNMSSINNQIPRSPGRPDNPPSPGSRWKKGKLIGRGTFGHVYVGFNSESGEMCAMKEVTLFDDAKSRESAKQLGQEVALLSRLRHQNIVQYYGSEMIDDKLYIYLEYVSGGSIHKLLQEYGRFGEQAIRSYTHQILSGLAYLHAKNTVHRDIKGANILVDPSGRVKLADFGMAKHITGQSCPLSFKGSPYWMAPEVIKNKNGCSLAVDIWSLGCTVLEMATSKPPWSQYEGIAAMFKIGNSKELPAIPSNLSDDGKDFVKQCLQRDPSNRPKAAELLRHPFVSNASPERLLLDSGHIEPAGDPTVINKGLMHPRNLSSLDMEGSTIRRLKIAKSSSISSSSHMRNVSCPVSPIGSPLLRSKPPKRINGNISPSPISSPKTISGSSTPLTGGSGALPSKQLMQLAHIHQGFGKMQRSSGNYITSSTCHDNKHDCCGGGSPVILEKDKQGLPFVRPGHGDTFEQYGLSISAKKEHNKFKASLDISSFSPIFGRRNGN